MYVRWVGAGRGGVGRTWLVASGTACALRLLGLWSFHLLCAAILMSVRYTNRQIKHTACGHAWESIPWRGAWWGALPLAWSCASLPPRFVAGLGDDVAAVRPMRVNPVCCGAWTCEVREVDLARWFSWGVHVIIITISILHEVLPWLYPGLTPWLQPPSRNVPLAPRTQIAALSGWLGGHRVAFEPLLAVCGPPAGVCHCW